MNVLQISQEEVTSLINALKAKAQDRARKHAENFFRLYSAGAPLQSSTSIATIFNEFDTWFADYEMRQSIYFSSGDTQADIRYAALHAFTDALTKEWNNRELEAKNRN